jgi:hypothetical protein
VSSLQIKWRAQVILSDAIKRAGAWFAKVKYWQAWVKKPLEIMDWVHKMLYTFNAVHLPFYLFPGYPDYNDPELANVFKAALPHVVELLALFATQLWLIPTQTLLPRTTTVDFRTVLSKVKAPTNLLTRLPRLVR